MKIWINLVLAVLVFCVCGCKKKSPVSKQPQVEIERKAEMSVEKKNFGRTSDGKGVDLYTLTNASGLRARITNYGGILVSLEVPDREGRLADITLGFDTLAEYVKGHPYFGATIGRYGNRIGKGKFTLDGVEYTLATNNDENHLHGGVKGFDKVVWDAEPVENEEGVGVKLTYLSKDGEEGYPGNLSCTVIYTLTKNDELKISYAAETDKATVINLTHHSYFNLAGQGDGDIGGHELMLAADKYTPVDEGLIPTGEIKSVKGSAMDFTKPEPIGSRIEQVAGGYDHNYVLNSSDGSLALAARVYDAGSGRVMEIYTTEPGIQFYSGNFLDGTIKGKGGKVYKKHYGFCLETQHFPDSPNKANFPSVILKPRQKYTHVTVHKFYTK